jgi:hypothetical protein
MHRFPLQAKFRVNGSQVFGVQRLRGSSPAVGQTPNPCGYTPTFDGQVGPANSNGGPLSAINGGNISQINDGSPDAAPVKAFNTLTGKNVSSFSSPVFWENIGSRITFSVNGGTSPQVIVQPYPTYYQYRNGTLVSKFPEALSPFLNFNFSPYPSGTVTCLLVSPVPDVNGNFPINVTPGGRCGDQVTPPDVSVIAPAPSYVQP